MAWRMRPTARSMPLRTRGSESEERSWERKTCAASALVIPRATISRAMSGWMPACSESRETASVSCSASTHFITDAPRSRSGLVLRVGRVLLRLVAVRYPLLESLDRLAKPFAQLRETARTKDDDDDDQDNDQFRHSES